MHVINEEKSKLEVKQLYLKSLDDNQGNSHPKLLALTIFVW